MLKNSSYQEKFIAIQPWLVSIIEVVKKDLKNEHLRIDKNFCKKYFLGKNPNQLQADEMARAYSKDIAEGNIGLGEFIASRWLLKNTEIYHFFEERLKAIQPEFDQIQFLTDDQSSFLIQEALKEFDAIKIYIFAIFNEVVFTEVAFLNLKKRAEAFTQDKQAEKEEQEAAQSLENLKKKHAREISTITDRFEKKIVGLQKKYLNDVEVLKKQVSALQRKLSETATDVSK